MKTNNYAKFFVIYEFDEKTKETIKKIFSFTENERADFCLTDEIHFTMLYLLGPVENKDKLAQIYIKLINTPSDLKINAHSLRIDQGHLIVHIAKRPELEREHSEYTVITDETNSCLNKNFKKWTPHFGVAWKSPEKITPENIDFIKQSFKKSKAMNIDLGFTGKKLTCRYEGRFETLVQSNKL